MKTTWEFPYKCKCGWRIYTPLENREHQCRFRVSEHGADAGTPVSGPSLCSPASLRAGDKGDGLEGKPPVPRRVCEPGNQVLDK
jgi:hypothetical protein